MAAFSFNRVEIDLTALRHNYRQIREAVGPRVRIMAIVKADAYGHGLVQSATTLYDAGARIFGVAEVEEGIRLREAGLAGEIVILLGPAPETCEAICHYDLSPVLFDAGMLATLSQKASAAGKRVQVHVKVDVGMGRLGVMPGEALPFCEAVARAPGLELTGLLSHFPMAEDRESGTTAAQLVRFKEVRSRLQQVSHAEFVSHIANSAALASYGAARLDMVRPGITLYGCYPDIEIGKAAGLDLKPVMRFKTRVIQVKEVPAGWGLSYGHIFVTSRPTRVAVLPVGYDDGYLRKLSNRAQVLIHGRRAPVCGRICMNACMVDVTDFPVSAGVRTGDEVMLMGRQQQEEINAEEVAGWLETISYEVLCLFGGRNQRVYTGGRGQDTGRS